MVIVNVFPSAETVSSVSLVIDRLPSGPNWKSAPPVQLTAESIICESIVAAVSRFTISYAKYGAEPVIFSANPAVLVAALEMASVRVRRKSVTIFAARESAFCFEIAANWSLGTAIADNMPRKITTKINSISVNAFFDLNIS